MPLVVIDTLQLQVDPKLWSLREDPAPFMPLVFHGITNEQGLVGTTETMMNYRNRKK